MGFILFGKMNITLNNFTNNIIKNYMTAGDIKTRPLYSNLAPLEKDTVSFSGRGTLIAASMADAQPERTCRNVEENAEPARFYLETILDKYLKPFTQINSEAKAKTFPVLKYSTRTKESHSIREKVVSRYTKKYTAEVDKFSSIVVDELLKSFTPLPGVDRDMLIEDAKRVLEYSHQGKKTPPFSNAVFYFSEIIEDFAKLNRIDFDSVDKTVQKNIFTDIINGLSDVEEAAAANGIGTYDPTTVKGIKYYANDIIGARIVMKESGPEYTAVVIEALKKAAEEGELKITSIENNLPDPRKLPKGKKLSDYIYATERQLLSLAKAANAPLIKNKSKSGYLAIHINVDLSSPLFNSYNGVYNGYSGEIQIIGSDVLQLKEIEDLCYKLKDNKNAIHIAYKPFKEHFQKYYKDDVKQAFDNYTYALYLAQRALPPGTKTQTRFPSIQELGFEGKVPPELDFNILKQIKLPCDKKKELMRQKQKLDENAKDKNIIRTLKQAGDIKTLKSLIGYHLK